MSFQDRRCRNVVSHPGDKEHRGMGRKGRGREESVTFSMRFEKFKGGHISKEGAEDGGSPESHTEN